MQPQQAAPQQPQRDSRTHSIVSEMIHNLTENNANPGVADKQEQEYWLRACANRGMPSGPLPALNPDGSLAENGQQPQG